MQQELLQKKIDELYLAAHVTWGRMIDDDVRIDYVDDVATIAGKLKALSATMQMEEC